MPSYERIRVPCVCGGPHYVEAEVCAASVGLPLSQVTIWCSIVGYVFLVEDSDEVGWVRWTIGSCGVMSTRRGIA